MKRHRSARPHAAVALATTVALLLASAVGPATVSARTTKLLKDITPGRGSTTITELTRAGGQLFFRGNSGLWRSRGSRKSTKLLRQFRIPKGLEGAAGALYFDPGNEYDCRLWTSDGSGIGTRPVPGFCPHAPLQDGPVALGKSIFFGHDDGINGRELWKSDGTKGSSGLVKDIQPGPQGSLPDDPYARRNIRPVAVGGSLFFAADDGTHGYELWKSDGTRAGTKLVKDIDPTGGSGPALLTNVGGTLFFLADDGTHGYELWKSDGSAAGTKLVKEILPGTSWVRPSSLTDVGGTLYFVADDGQRGRELWKSDGTTAGTKLVRDILPGPGGSAPMELTNVAGTLYFTAIDATHGRELWKSRGTKASTRRVKDIRAGQRGSDPKQLTALGRSLYFTADAKGGRELWKSRGTSASTRRVKDIRVGRKSSDPTELTRIGRILFFVADDGRHGRELWKHVP